MRIKLRRDPSSRQWREAAQVLRNNATKFDQFAEKSEQAEAKTTDPRSSRKEAIQPTIFEAYIAGMGRKPYEDWLADWKAQAALSIREDTERPDDGADPMPELVLRGDTESSIRALAAIRYLEKSHINDLNGSANRQRAVSNVECLGEMILEFEGWRGRNLHKMRALDLKRDTGDEQHR